MILPRPLLTLFLLLLAVPAYSRGESYQVWLDEAFPADGPGATVILVRDGEVIFRGAAGMANLELAVPMKPDHVLRIASITKQFTAAAILLLQDRGQLDVTDDISRYLPDFPTQGERITIAQLLSHTSGIFSFTDIPGYWRGDLIRTDRTVDEMIELCADQPLRFTPGSEFSYSNSGYTLLGAIIERISGKSYAGFMQTEIFEPLGMADTEFGGWHVVPRRASGYELHEDRYFNALPISMTHAHAAGAQGARPAGWPCALRAMRRPVVRTASRKGRKPLKYLLTKCPRQLYSAQLASTPYIYAPHFEVPS